MSHYSICHKDALPEKLEELWGNPRPLGESHFVYRGKCPETEAAYESDEAVDAEGVRTVLEDDMVIDVTGILSLAAHGPVVLVKADVLAVISAVEPSVEA